MAAQRRYAEARERAMMRYEQRSASAAFERICLLRLTPLFIVTLQTDADAATRQSNEMRRACYCYVDDERAFYDALRDVICHGAIAHAAITLLRCRCYVC